MATKPPNKKAVQRAMQHAEAEGLYKTNKQKGNPRAGKKYIDAKDAQGRTVHRYFDKSGNLEKAVVVKGAVDEAVKRSGGKSKTKRVGINRSSWAK